MDDHAVARQIQRDQIDVLVDLNGHTARSRLTVLAQRAAPVQLSWLGYWGTTGLAGYVDGILVDQKLMPADCPDRDSFCEPLLELPQGRWCYRPVPWIPEPQEPPCIKRGWICFGSFNSTAKLNRRLLECWAEILKAVPKSQLLLKWVHWRDQGMRDRLLKIMVESGVDKQRIELRGPSFHQPMLVEYGDVDIALDPFPFNGGLSSCEALWMGVPLVTLRSEGTAALMAGRQGSSLLELIDHNQWIANSTDEYIQIAKDLAQDSERLRDLRYSLRPAMQQSELCNERAFCQGFSTAVEQAWLRQTALIHGTTTLTRKRAGGFN